jgi:Uma2 family endonuclease
MAIVDTSNSLADVVEQLGNIQLSRIRMHPPPGMATAADVESINDHEDRLFELVDGILVEKVMGFRESLIAAAIIGALRNYVAPRNLGLVVGADGMMQLFPKTVRIPDAAFIAWDRLPGGRVPSEAIPSIAPTLAVEVLSKSNTVAEMARKRKEYFESGTELVWEVDIDRRCVKICSRTGASELLEEQAMLSGGSALPGFEVPLHVIFAELDRQPN